MPGRQPLRVPAALQSARAAARGRLRPHAEPALTTAAAPLPAPHGLVAVLSSICNNLLQALRSLPAFARSTFSLILSPFEVLGPVLFRAARSTSLSSCSVLFSFELLGSVAPAPDIPFFDV